MDELREHHEKNITVHVKHAPLDNDTRQHLQTKLSTLAKGVNVQCEHDIANINSYLVSQQVNVYRLEVEEVSLEEIFLNLSSEIRSA
ncbi:DUF4162 domain-containing protein [uncultured Exiguobacterium sp.]|uniref:ATP-binding protein DrrA1-3 family domain-containing protein n=1 Tax=uncultured Exiguobacterium sp. TaxID=202669 RepID=UPI0025EDBDDA|nr:DUF4162 domain-containing protein [uncultured Exiguobacterium sp.]